MKARPIDRLVTILLGLNLLLALWWVFSTFADHNSTVAHF
jgi:hypothetical protein